MDTNNNISLFELQVDHESTIFLRETAKWAKFLAILGFVWCGIFILLGFFILTIRLGTYIDAYNTGMAVGISVGYMAVAVVYFFPCIYTLNFARKMKTALQNNDQEHLITSLRNLRSTFRYLGILAIVGLALMVVLVFFNLFGRFG